MPLTRDTIIGRYRIRDRVGGGGNGDVYRAHDDVLARDVAIKILSERAEADAAAVHQITREARAASALNHPNIVTVYDVGEADVGPYIVMEIIEGHTVRTLLSERPSTDVIIGIGMQIARALELAH